jgi:hypothetical protein
VDPLVLPPLLNFVHSPKIDNEFIIGNGVIVIPVSGANKIDISK